MNIREINHVDELTSLQEVWSELLSRTPQANFFQTLDWLLTYWKHFGATQRLRILVVEEGGEVIADGLRQRIKQAAALVCITENECIAVGAIKHPNKVIKSFLISYPFHDKEKVLQRYNYFDRKYAEGIWWTKILCQTEIFYKWLFYPYFFLFKYKYRRSYMDFFKHTYQSAHGAIKNTIFEDDKENLYAIAEKVILINGEKDSSVDFLFVNSFNNVTIARMGHIFFGYEKKIADVIKSNI